MATDNDSQQPDDTPPDDEQFSLIDAVDAAYEGMDDEGNLQPEPAETGEGAGDGEPGESETEGGEAASETDTGQPEGEQPAGEQPAGQEGEQAAEQPDADLELTEEERAQLSERATQRFDKLVDRVKTESQEKQQYQERLQDVEQRHETLVGALRETNADPQQLSQVLTLTADLVSGDPQIGQQAVQRAYEMVKGYAQQYGVSLPQASLVESYPDLVQKVQDGSMTLDAAEENARLRSVTASQQAVRQRDAQASAEQQQFQQSANQAFSEWQQLQQQWQQSDPDYEQKRQLLQDYEKQLAEGLMNGQVHPTQVARLMQDRYDTISRTMQAVSSSVRQQQQSQQREPNPIRPGASRSSGQDKPKYDSIADAIEQEYARM